MQLASWVRARLWPAVNWVAELDALRSELKPSPEHGQKLWELGQAYEHCVADRGRVLVVLVEAARAGSTEAREPALALARQQRAYSIIAELSLVAIDHATAGRAYIDAGRYELAIEPLSKTGDTALLAIAKGGKVEAESEIGAAIARKQYADAARIAKVALPDKRTSIIVNAKRAAPHDTAIEALFVADLLERGAVTELLDHYRASFVAAPSRREYVERMRAAAFELLARDLQKGLALRLLRLALETAYDELLPEIAAHLACWEILVAHARDQKSLGELVPLVIKALAAPLSQDDAIYLARLGLEIAWHEMNDTVAAQPYAATLLDFVPEHPLGIAFERALALPELPVVNIRPSDKLKALEPPPPIAHSTNATAAAVAASRTSGRMQVIKATPPSMPYADDKPVPRAPSQAIPKPHRQSGRLALLSPPPARTTTLRRDVSPVPEPRTRAETTPRAPRVIVPVDAVIELPNASFFTTVLRDMSTSGAFVVTKRKLEIGALLGLELRLPTRDALTLVTHQASAKVMRQTDIGFGIQFVDPSPELVAAITALT